MNEMLFTGYESWIWRFLVSSTDKKIIFLYRPISQQETVQQAAVDGLIVPIQPSPLASILYDSVKYTALSNSSLPVFPCGTTVGVA